MATIERMRRMMTTAKCTYYMMNLKGIVYTLRLIQFFPLHYYLLSSRSHKLTNIILYRCAFVPCVSVCVCVCTVCVRCARSRIIQLCGRVCPNRMQNTIQICVFVESLKLKIKKKLRIINGCNVF